MRLIASRVAGSIENASLYRKVDRQNRTLRTLAQLSQEFSSILDLDELLGKIAASVRTLINYDAFSILLVDAEKKLLRHRFSVRYDQRVDLDNIPLWGRELRERRPNRGRLYASSIRCTTLAISPRSPIFIRNWRCRWWCGTA